MHRADGGTHEPDNLRLQCSACHGAIHRGTLEVVDGVAHRPNEPIHTARRGIDDAHAGTRTVDVAAARAIDDAHVGTSAFEVAAARAQARDALVGLGWKAAIARAAVDEAIAHVGAAPIEIMIREALRRCPRAR